MMFRYPDKPIATLSRSGLDDVPDDYIAELKMDGWRCAVERTASGVTFTSRHNKPIPVGPELQHVREFVSDLPVGTILDAEWLARRPAAREEAIWFFDLMQMGPVSLWQESTRDRLLMLRAVVPADWIVPTANSDYAGFFDGMMERPDAEGIVLKRRDARYIGSVRESANNPGWIRCKWRAGEDGLTAIVRRPAVVAS